MTSNPHNALNAVVHIITAPSALFYDVLNKSNTGLVFEIFARFASEI